MKLALVFPGQGSQSVGMLQGYGAQEVVDAKPLEGFDKRWATDAMANERFVRVVYDTLTSVYVARVREAQMSGGK